VAVFAGGFTFGTIISLDTSLANFAYISDLLSYAFILFAVALFVGISIQYLLRRHRADELLLFNMWLLSQIHTILVVLFLMAGFITLFCRMLKRLGGCRGLCRMTLERFKLDKETK
jgi:hypothetical protein